MKSFILIACFTILACMVVPCLMSHHGFSKSQSIDAKEQYTHKKSGFTRNNKHDYFARYQVWDDLDWSNEDMMQHPIDESPRKVTVVCCLI